MLEYSGFCGRALYVNPVPTTSRTGRAKRRPRMCSVLGCDSWRHSTQRFGLPEDPEKRLEWVQFLFEVNGQRLKESSWTDITICREHFTDDCFVNLTVSGTVQLKSGAVPSLFVNTEPEEPVESPQHVDPVKTTDALCQCDDLELCNEKTEQTLTDVLSPGASQKQETASNTDSNKGIPALQEMKGKYVVNENCLFELSGHKCPSCGGKLQMEKVIYGELIIFNLWCLRCHYRNQWKSQVSDSISPAEDGHLTGKTEVTPETKEAVLADDNPSTVVLSAFVTFSGEERDPSDDGEEGNKGGMSSDWEWNPSEKFLLAEELTKESEKETEDERKKEVFDSPGGLKINELCTECGSFFTLKPHICEHKIKPYSCNICGKRCVSEIALKSHSNIHDETYEHPCKYCFVTFKTRVDKFKHEQTHQDKKDPYKCPDCPETFANNKERRIHLANHRVSKEFKCGVCGIEFKDLHHLRRHSVVHTGLKPYKCSVCQRGFNQTSHLKSHMRLHTGERPYKCQQCDKCFNHNVSLKCHVQRYHTLSSASQQKQSKIDERANDAEDNRDKRFMVSEFDNVEEKQDVKQEVQKTRAVKPKNKKRSTGRPRGRPKRNIAGDIKGQRSSTKTLETKVQKSNKTGSSNEEREDEQTGSDSSFDSAREEEKKGETRKSTGNTRRTPKNDSDSDFEPEVELKKKRYSRQNSGKKQRERPKKGLVV